MKLKDTEGTHRLLFEAHRHAVTAAEKIHMTLSILYAEARDEEARRKITPIIKQLESARDAIDRGWKEASEARTDLIGTTGCSGECSKRRDGE